MKVIVENCWSGNNNYHFRCTLPDGNRVLIGHNSDNNGWCKGYASELRDYLEQFYNVKRNNVRIV